MAAPVLAPARNAIPRPFLKWVGGKRQLLPELLVRIPDGFGRYHEPFVGAGALFFALDPEVAVLGDANLRLVRTWRAIRDEVDAVVERLATMPNDKAFYLRTRAQPIDEQCDVAVAAWMIFLNKTGFNGLYRVNSRGGFNVPFGRYERPRICDEPNLYAVSQALQPVDLRHEQFDAVLDRARRGDLVYFDPPYVPASATASFTSYTRRGFDFAQQEKLRDVALTLKHRGVHVLLSNSDTELVHALYRDDFHIDRVTATRAINCKGSGRGRVGEVIIRG